MSTTQPVMSANRAHSDSSRDSVSTAALRLLFVAPERFPSHRADVTVLFGKYLPRVGIESDLVAGRSPGEEGRVEWGGGRARLCRLPRSKLLRHARTFVHNLTAMFGVDRAGYDAIQVRDMPITAVFGLAAARMKRLKFFYWMSYPMPEADMQLAIERGLSEGVLKFIVPWSRGALGKSLLYGLVLRSADHVFVQSDLMREEIAAKGIPRDRITAVPMGVDVEVARPAHIDVSTDARLANRRILVYLGTLDRSRRIELLFEMLAIVRRDVPNVLLILAGDTEDDVHRRWLRERARATGVSEALLWTGWLAPREAWRYVRAAEIGLSPIPRGRLFDVSSPTKVIEYLALGVPAVANDQPDQKTVVEQSDAGVSVPLTPQDFAQAVIGLLGDDAARARMAAKGPPYVARTRSYQVIAHGLAQRYRELLGRRAS